MPSSVLEGMQMNADSDRRRWLAYAGSAVLSAAVIAPVFGAEEGKEKKGETEIEVPAAEDLMREHGILRRALLVYAETASRLSHGNGNVPLDELGRTATLFRSFGEDYHERSLEEKHVFPPLIRAGGQHATLARTLTAQHERGRQITQYVEAVAKKGRIAAGDSPQLASTLLGFVRMYEHHAAIEDTIIFPAWKHAITPAEYEERTEQFEDLEHKMFGKDGFEDALKKIAAIEQAFGLGDLNALTAPPPPKLA
jgi:hemerythrin-like domain-containing protein